MNWLKRKLRNWIFDEPGNKIKAARPIEIDTSHGLCSRGMNFTFYTANGGSIVEIRNYDRKTDENKYILHIIKSDEDLGQQLAQIITFEMLKT